MIDLRELKLQSIMKNHPNLPYPESFMPKFSDRTANGLTKCIIEYIKLIGGQAERINTMGRPIDNRKVVTDVLGHRKQIGSLTWIRTTGTRGSADISATFNGMSIKIEVKIGADKQSEDQKKYQEQVENAGGVYFIARDFKSFKQFIHSL